MLHKAFLLVLVCMLVLLPGGRGVSHAAFGPSVARHVPAFAPGQVLVRFKPDISLRTATSLATAHGAIQVKRIANHIFSLAVPRGTEEQMMKVLASDPAVQQASLNYRIVEPLASLLEPITDELPASQAGTSLSQEQPSCITDLWMSATGQGEPLQDNMLPSDTPLVYVFFEFADCELEAVRIQVFYLGSDTPPEEVFSKEQIISGSGVQGNKVEAWEHFTKQGTFPVGKYLTIVSISPEGGWDEAKKVWWYVSTFPDDYWFRGTSNYQWPLHSTGKLASLDADINMPQAWDITTGSPDIIIANVSTGVWIDHPDLKNKIWTNRDEIPGNGIDDDENGCIDDVHGCEFFNGEANPNPIDVPGGWGTVTGGVAAAETNNEIGMAGVSWGARIMPIKVLRLLPGNVLGGYIADMIMAIDYAVSNGARVIHVGPRVDSSVSEGQLALLHAAIDDAVSRGALVVAGTGNITDGDDGNGDESHVVYPAGFDSVVAVGCSDLRDERCWFSNYWSGIDLVAPGELVLSTYFSEEYQYVRRNETNLAAAHVEGVASLIWSVNPDLSPNEVRAILRESATDLGSPGYDEEYGYGKLDAATAVALTSHHLWLSTANLDRLELVFLLDDQVGRACRNVWNWGTGPQTWTLKSEGDWPTVEDPTDPVSAPVPSDIRLCVNVELLPASTYGTFETKVEAYSTLTHHEGPVTIDATAVYQSDLSRVRLSFIRRDKVPDN